MKLFHLPGTIRLLYTQYILLYVKRCSLAINRVLGRLHSVQRMDADMLVTLK